MKEITADELKAKLELREAVAVVDIREADEYADWHIHSSCNIPVYNALSRRGPEALMAQTETLPRDRPIVTVCRMGNASKTAAQILGSLGYEAFSLRDGIRGWSGVWSEARVPLARSEDATFIQMRRNGKGCLSYLVGSQGQAAIIDPNVDAQVYVQIAEREGLRITQVLETHVQGDHLSRARELCQITGATCLLPENQRVTFPYTPMRDREKLRLGDLSIEVIATPGHTEESVCYLIDGEALLTGDTLFVESVGRPDLETGDAGAEAGAHKLHHSLHDKILELPGEIRIYPAHYGRPIDFDGVPVGASLRELKAKLNLLELDEQEFVQTVLSSLQAKPPNFQTIIAINEGKAELGWSDPLDLEAGPNRCAVR